LVKIEAGDLCLLVVVVVGVAVVDEFQREDEKLNRKTPNVLFSTTKLVFYISILEIILLQRYH